MKLIDTENQLRRNNLRIDGIVKSPNEILEECELKVQEMLKTKLKMISKRIVAIVLLLREETPAYYLQNGKIEK